LWKKWKLIAFSNPVKFFSHHRLVRKIRDRRRIFWRSYVFKPTLHTRTSVVDCDLFSANSTLSFFVETRQQTVYCISFFDSFISSLWSSLVLEPSMFHCGKESNFGVYYVCVSENLRPHFFVFKDLHEDYVVIHGTKEACQYNDTIWNEHF
jgi:hypothetical protein